jgi:hypothetical protein
VVAILVIVMCETQISVPNAVLFVSDPSGRVSIPPDTSAAVVTSTADCVAVWALSEVDGETTIKLADRFDEVPPHRVFEEQIDAPGQKIAVSDSGGQVILERPVASKRPKITIWVSDLENPDVVCVQAV